MTEVTTLKPKVNLFTFDVHTVLHDVETKTNDIGVDDTEKPNTEEREAKTPTDPLTKSKSGYENRIDLFLIL